MRTLACALVLLNSCTLPALAQTKADAPPAPAEVLAGLQQFFAKSALPNGNFQPGVDPGYKGLSDCAASDLAAPTYAVVLHRTLGWKLPYEKQTLKFFLSRQQPDGAFVNVAGTMDPKSPGARLYNTTQALVALHGLGGKPKHDPLPVFDALMAKDYKDLPAYTTSFFPLAYATQGKAFPKEHDQKMRALMVQAKDGYMHNHIAATFHLSHYYALLKAPTPQAKDVLTRILKDQRPDGSWLINPLARDRHATFDAVFTLVRLGGQRADCKQAVARAADWALSCRNDDGGFGHYPGSTSDADANYFQVGVLVMAGRLPVADKLPDNAELLGWGHLFK